MADGENRVLVARSEAARAGGLLPAGDELGFRRLLPGGVGEKGVEEGCRCTEPVQHCSAELGVLGLGGPGLR